MHHHVLHAFSWTRLLFRASIRRSRPGARCWKRWSVTGPGSWWGWVPLLSASSAWWWDSSFCRGWCEAPGVCPCSSRRSGLPTLPGNRTPASTWPGVRQEVKIKNNNFNEEERQNSSSSIFQLSDMDGYSHNIAITRYANMQYKSNATSYPDPT